MGKTLNGFSIWSVGISYKTIAVILNNRELPITKMLTLGTSIHYLLPPYIKNKAQAGISVMGALA